jgi:Fe-S cluster assembly iron-binding protein IscA
MALDESKDNDEVFDDRGLKYVVEKDLYDRVKPITVDYVNSPFGSGFSIKSSLVAASGCGSSCSC